MQHKLLKPNLLKHHTSAEQLTTHYVRWLCTRDIIKSIIVFINRWNVPYYLCCYSNNNNVLYVCTNKCCCKPHMSPTAVAAHRQIMFRHTYTHTHTSNHLNGIYYTATKQHGTTPVTSAKIAITIKVATRGNSERI